MSAPKWADVIADLTGLRLAIYDELLCEGALHSQTIAAEIDIHRETIAQMEEALEWLERNRFLVRDDGRWRAVPMSVARDNFEKTGPIDRTTTPATRTAKEPSAAYVAHLNRPPPTLQTHQAEWFHTEGYRP